ncbi:hypothetical protein LSAT2_019590 [Lamellibrachia satsuma]|nr:hypothetical protein LSAT2_019590 [Lamellibrachia satsuma]
MSGAVCRILLYFAIFQVIVEFADSQHHCAESRVVVDRHLEVTVDCTPTHLSTIPVGAFPEDTTHLVLSRLKIHAIPDNAFAQLRNLRSIDLSNNDIHTLRNASFHGLTKLKTLKLNGNAISSTEGGVFSELPSLETLLMTSPPHNPHFAVEYSSLAKLEVLDFFDGHIDRIDIALMNDFRNLNISSLAFRNQDAHSIEPGAFSNFSNLRSINLCCNGQLGFKAAIVALVQTQNTEVDTVILDNVCRRGREYSIFDMSDFCNQFGKKIRRLSIKDNEIIGFEAENAHCLAELRELDISYNPIISFGPKTVSSGKYLSYLGHNMPHLCTLSFSMNTGYYDKYCGCEKAALYYDASSYFSSKSSCLAHSEEGGLVLASQTPWQDIPLDVYSSEEVRHLFIPPSVQSIRVEHWLPKRTAKMTRSVMINTNNNIRYISVAYTDFPIVISASCYGFHMLETIDISHCNILKLTPKYVYFPNLKNLNISFNQLDTESAGLSIGCPKLEDFDMSYNQFRKIDPTMFSTSRNLKHINLDGNALQDVYLELSNLTRLETLTLRSNKLHDLGSKFTSELDSLFRVKKFTLDVRNNTFVCSCASLAFIRWIQTTGVNLVERDELTCLLSNKETLLVDVSLADLTNECRRQFHVIITSVIVIIIGIVAVLVGLVWNRWYIKYRIILCRVSTRNKRRTERIHIYDAAVLYFAHASNLADHAASKQISAWVLKHLLLLAEAEEGLKLFVDDRDGTSMTKTELFISAFEQSDRLIVCITAEFLNDESCKHNINLALAAKKPPCHFIFINFCAEEHTIPNKQLRHLMQAKAGATCLVWGENDDDHSDFNRRLRGALNRGSAGNGCNGLLGRVRQLPPTVSLRELEHMNPQ